MKIDNNPFAKGFREQGQSRIKRKLSTKPNTIEANDVKKEDFYHYNSDITENKLNRKRSNSLTESNASADDSTNSIGEEIASPSISGTSSPATSAHDYTSSYDDGDDFHSSKQFESMNNRSNEWYDMMSMRYFQPHNGPYQHPLYLPGSHQPNPFMQHMFPAQRVPSPQEPLPIAPVPPRKKNSFSISAILGCEC